MKLRRISPVLGLTLGVVAATSFVPVTAAAQSSYGDEQSVASDDKDKKKDESGTDEKDTTKKKDTKKKKHGGYSGSDETTGSGETGTEDTTIGAGEPSRNLPPVRSSNEERPPPPAPEAPRVGVVKQAGIGGDVAYARAHVLELGGTAGFTAASDFTQVTIAPSLGWFVIDNLELSGILQFSHISAGGADANFVTALVEPSFHLPIQDYLYGFAGLGAGLTWIEGPGAGFALAPRIGLNIMVGRSGVLTPQLQLQYSTHEAVATNTGSLLAVSVTYGGGIGYTVMW